MRDCVVTCTQSPPDELFTFLESIVFGHAGVRYRRLHLATSWKRFSNPTVLCLWHKKQLVGCYVLDPRTCQLHGESVLGVYRGLLCIHPDFRRTGASAMLMQRARAEFNRMGEAVSSAVFSFGCVDANNTPSLKLLSEQGCVPHTTLNARLLYRQWPRPAVPLAYSDVDSNASLVSLHPNSLWDVTEVPGAMRLSLRDEQGERIGAHVVRTALAMQTLGALNDWLVRWFVLPFPFAKRRFNPHEFVYTSLSYVYIRPGCESDWPKFISALTHHQGVHYAQLLIDTKGPVWQQLAEHTRFVEEAGERLQLLVRPENEKARLLLADRAPVHLYPVDL